MTPTTGFAAIPRVSRVTGRLRVPGDKSISHRYAMLAAIAEGESRLTGYAPGADCAATLACLEGLGVHVSRGAAITILGRGPRGLRAPSAPLDAANSGTSMRLLAGLLAAHPFTSIVGGDASLSRRPMRRVIEPLTRMGATIDARDGRPPLTIHGASLRAISHLPEVPSAQVKSAVLLAGLHANGRTAVKEPTPTRDHTERALEAFGGHVIREGEIVAVDGGQRLRAITADVPGDVSSALFWLALAGGTPDSDLVIEGVGLNPSRTAVFEVLRRAGVRIDLPDFPPEGGSDVKIPGEPSGPIRVRFGDPASFEITPEEVPLMIDEIPGLAALAAMQPGVTMTVRGAQELRVKESDRISMLARGFSGLGIRVDEYEDGFTIHGGPPEGGEADAAGDHRLAMAFAIAGSRARGPVHVTGADAVAVSYPGFFDELDRIARGVNTDKIYLVGFMAAGKTTVARRIAARLGWRAEDVDELIEARERATVADIFAKQGEAYFRSVEREILRLVMPLRHAVVATGGGTFMDPESQHAINLDGTSVWLDVPLATVIARLPTDGRRPLSADRAQMERLFAARQTGYACAHLRIEATGPADDIAERIMDALHLH